MRENVVVIGAVALGPKAACRYKRLNPDGHVVLLDRGRRISYGGCGIPYYVSGDVSDADELQSTSFHMLRDAAFFRDPNWPRRLKVDYSDMVYLKTGERLTKERLAELQEKDPSGLIILHVALAVTFWRRPAALFEGAAVPSGAL